MPISPEILVPLFVSNKQSLGLLRVSNDLDIDHDSSFLIIFMVYTRPVNGSGLLGFGSGLIRPVKLTGHPNPTR